MDVKRMMFGFVFITIIFIAFNLAFGVKLKSYIPQEDLETLETLSRRFVGEAKPSFIGQVYFFISSFWTITKTTFNMVTVGFTSMIFDIGGQFLIPYAILSLLVGVIIYLLGITILEKLSGRNG